MRIRRNVLVLMILLTLISLLAASAVSVSAQEPAGKLAEILERGTLNCGVSEGLAGFSRANPDSGVWEGLDADFCRVIAAAIFGAQEDIDSVITFVPLSADARFAALQSGEIDVLNRNTTWSFTRDITLGADFGPTTFYDGQGLLIKVEDGFASLADMQGATFCSTSGTTTEKNITDAYRALFNEDPTLVLKATAAENLADFESGTCDVLTSDKSQLASLRSTSSNPSAYALIADTLSKEPLGPMYPANDSQFADIVDWAVYATWQAEEFGLDSTNIAASVEEQAASTEGDGVWNVELQRFFGLTEDNYGAALGIANTFAVDIISTVGNYGEIYERNVTPIGVPREGSLNALWTQGGLHYSPAWR
jgi:general L-amino acid transport system substrate-binding protein